MVLWYYKEIISVYRERKVAAAPELDSLLDEIVTVTQAD